MAYNIWRLAWQVSPGLLQDSPLPDHRIFFGRRGLQRVADEYVTYYNERRPHQSLDLNARIQRFDSKINIESKKIRRNRIVDGIDPRSHEN